MSKVLKSLFLFFFCLFAIIVTEARSYGDDTESAPYAFVVDGPRKINVRMYQDASSSLMTQLKDGDTVYVSGIYADEAGHDWYAVSGGKGWIYKPDSNATTKLVPVDNPYYTVQDTTTAEFTPKEIESSHIWAKWIFFILALAAAVFSIWWVWAYLQDNYTGDFEWFTGGVTENGMKKRFFFNWEPYQFVICVTLALILSLVAALVAVLVIGGAVFVLLWIVKIITYILLWVCIIGGVLGALAIWGGDDSEEKGIGCVGLIIGIVCIIFKSQITNFADACSDAGLAFLKEFNILGFAVDLVKEYWAQALFWISLPLMIFVACAILWLLFAGVLIAFEALVTWRYNINHPCPHCHEPSEPAEYLSDGTPLPEGVRLRPGLYGIFHITHPETGEEMPTMLLNGRDSLTRVCPHCGHRINAKEGTERHLILVGGPESGKTTIAYRFIAELIRLGYEPEFTDEKNTIKNSDNVIAKINKIAEQGVITDALMPQKTTTGQTGAMQLMLKRKLSLVDYRLFINDLAGERFNDLVNARFTGDSLNFFRDANVLVILIDPYTMSFSNCNNDFVNDWIEKNSVLSDDMKMDPMRLKTALDNAISAGAIDRRKLRVDIVLAKCDAGYIPSNVNLADPDAIRAFVISQLGLAPVVQWAEGMKSVNFFAVAAMAKGEASRMAPFAKSLISQLGIS